MEVENGLRKSRNKRVRWELAWCMLGAKHAVRRGTGTRGQAEQARGRELGME